VGVVTNLANKLLGMSTAQFSLVYDGEALRAGEMDVRELAPALLGVGELFEAANKQLNENRASLSVRVRTGFRPGSFVIDLTAHQTIIEQLKGLITGEHIIVTAAIVTILFGGRGLFDLLKFGKGEKPESVTKLEDGNVQLAFGHSTTIITGNVFNLYNDPNVRHAVKPVAKPLESPGIDNLKAIQDEKVLNEVTKKDLLGLTRIKMEERVIDESEGIRFLQIVSLSFKEDNKWRLSEGGAEAFYSLDDSEFRQKIEQQSERFGKGDSLKCMVKTVTSVQEDGTLKTDRIIVKVLEHSYAPKQARLFPHPTDH
jgi:hypothetical protein